MMSGDIALNCKSLFPSHFSLCWVASLQQGYFTFIKNSLCMSGLLHREKMRARGREGMGWCECVCWGGGFCFKWPQSAPFEHVWHSLSPLVLMLTEHSSWLCASAQWTWRNLLRLSTSYWREEVHHTQQSSQSLWTFDIPAVLTFNKGIKNLLDPAAVCQVKGALLWWSTAFLCEAIFCF